MKQWNGLQDVLSRLLSKRYPDAQLTITGDHLGLPLPNARMLS